MADLADDLELGRQVAIKVLPPKIARDLKMKRRLAREARAASALKHPNIVTIYSIEESAGLNFIVMEYVEGTSLQRILQEGPMEFSRILNMGRQTAEALEAAHRAGIIHRDIKPANIMITTREQIKLLDFGLAKRAFKEVDAKRSEERLSDLTGIGVPIGTVIYMSPEQTRGEFLDERTDIFSLGCVLYEASTGHLPFSGPSIVSIMDAIATKECQPPSSINPAIPADFDRMIQRALAKDICV
jgi:eukaryotic-like serine/threonine-protein kinase